MKVYWYAPETESTAARERCALIAQILGRSGVEVISKDQRVEEAFPDTYRQVERRGESFLDYVDACIIEGSEQDAEVGYLLAYAVAQKKPALLLVARGASARNPLATFGRQIPKNLRLVFYDARSAEKILLSFLGALGQLAYQEVPSIKFTLRITPKIEQYLHWKTHNTETTKADFLRKVILDDIIAQDEAFQRFLKKGKDRA